MATRSAFDFDSLALSANALNTCGTKQAIFDLNLLKFIAIRAAEFRNYASAAFTASPKKS
jgi:hypothetical protein